MLFWTLSFLTAVFVLVTLLPLSKRTEWWVRGADFPRMQFALFGLAVFCGVLLGLDRGERTTWLMGALLLAGVLYQAWWIWPYTPLHSKEVKTSAGRAKADRLRIMSINVLMTNREADALLRIVRAEKPDVLVTLETNRWWENALRSLEIDYPHTLKCPLENLYGMHVYSKLPFEDPKIQFLVEPDLPSMHTLVVLPSGYRVCLHFLHPAPPSPTENPTSDERDAELVMVGRSVAKARFPAIVSGDLNDVAWSATTRLFRKVSRLLDPRIGRGMFNTYHAGHWYCRWPVDHFFHSKDFSLVRLARLPACGSDHFPVLVELERDERTEPEPELPPPDAEENAEAKEKMAKQAASSTEVHRPGENGRGRGRDGS